MTRGKGEGGIFQDARGMWTAVLELPPGPDGKRRQKRIRSRDKRTVVTKLQDMQRELRLRGDLPTADVTVEQWFLHWFEHVVLPNNRPKTAAGYHSVIRLHIIPTIGKLRLEKLNAEHIRAVATAMTDAGLSSTYALNAHRIMAAAFEAAIREGKLGRNPAKLTKAPRKAVVKIEALTLPESVEVLRHVLRDPVIGARWAMSLLTGARRGEVIGLEVDRVGDTLDLSWQMQRLATGARGTRGEPGRPNVPHDFEYRHVEGGLYLTRPKSGAGWREIPLVDPMRSILEAHMERTPENRWGLVFTEDGYPLDPDQDSTAWRAVLASTGIEKNVRLHDLRHTAVDLLYLSGVPEDLIQEIVGHSTRAMSRAYKTRVSNERLTAAMEQFSAQFGDIKSLGH
ncbi:MAG TPA: site-specific integrase [Candidatus Lumbricidophila sp.]|nr:site-specific integrase [Candidatus Lumbricidophila sp.]